MNWEETVAGLPMLIVRDCLKKTRGAVSREYIADILTDQFNTNGLIKELLARGWIEQVDDNLFANTVEGNAVAQAKKLKPISRKNADELLRGVVDAVDEINSSSLYAYKISKLAVFGSYLSDCEDLGDLDLAYELEALWTPENVEEVRQKTLLNFPPPKSADWMRRLYWPEEVVLKKIAISDRLSLELLSTVEQYGWPYRILRGQDAKAS